MPLRASAWLAASGWMSETTFGFTTTYFFCRSTGRIWSSTRASASATFFRRTSPRTSETTLDGPASACSSRGRATAAPADTADNIRKPRRDTPRPIVTPYGLYSAR